MARIVLNTFGSFGDVHPYLALAIELNRRGHRCVIATAEVYRQKINAEGVEFFPVRPDVGELLQQPEMIRKLWHPTKGTVYLLRDYLMPRVEESYADLIQVCENADLLLTHAAGYAGPIVAQVRSIPWLSVALQPAIFFSTCDPPVVAAAPWTRHLYRLGRWTFAAMLAVARRETRRWAKPVLKLRARMGLDTRSNPLIEGQFSTYGTLTLFSKAFAPPQPDWPAHSSPTGFIYYDKLGHIKLNHVKLNHIKLNHIEVDNEPAAGLSLGLREFLANGPPPVLFTLGSSAVTHPGTFYGESARAARQVGIRALLLTGKQAGPAVAVANDSVVHAEEYVSYSAIMPMVSAVVHQGGIGTVAQTLRAGKPMLVVPWAHDQPDNGYRLERMGVARVVPRHRYTGPRVERELKALLRGSYGDRAKEVAASLRHEDGLSAACNRIENVLRTSASCEPVGAPS